MRILTALVAAVGLSLATPALAAPPAGDHGDHAEHADKGHDDHGDHGDAAHGDDHGDDHGGGHGEHHYFTDDDDHDGVPNWRDSMNGDVENEDTYVLDTLGYHAFNLGIYIAIH